MKFKNVSKSDTYAANGTCLQGEIDVDYATLRKCFGVPGMGDEYKVQREWVLVFADGTVATIYDWKEGKKYNGAKYGKSYKDVTNWHIGGNTKWAVKLVEEALEEFMQGVPA